MNTRWLAAANVFIVDDDPAILDELTLMLMLKQEGMMVEVFDSAEAFLAINPRGCRGYAIIDIQMPGMNGLQLQQLLSDLSIHLPMIFLTGYGDIPTSVRAIKAGAVDFLTKPVTREKLLASVQSAIIEDEIQHEHEQVQNHQQARALLADLTERERQVMLLAIAGNSNKEIARHLGISHRTVEIHKSKLKHKTWTTNLVELACIVQECEQIPS